MYVFAVHFILMRTLNQGNSRWEMSLCFNAHCDARQLHWPFPAAVLGSFWQMFAFFRLVLDFYCPLRTQHRATQCTSAWCSSSWPVPAKRWHNCWPDTYTQHREKMGGLGQLSPQGWQRPKASRRTERPQIHSHTPTCQCVGCSAIWAALLFFKERFEAQHLRLQEDWC